MLSEEFSLSLEDGIDLGIARSYGSAHLTTAGYVMGTLGYMAPEHAVGRKNLTLRADLFSLGVVLLEALIGMQPVLGNQVMINLLDLSALVPEAAGAQLHKAITALLEKDPSRRPISGRAIIEMLAQGE